MYVRLLIALCCGVFLTATPSSVEAQSNPRFGRWLLKSDAPAPASNIMTYDPFGAGGMKVTIQSVNA